MNRFDIQTLMDMVGADRGPETATNMNFSCPFKSKYHSGGADRHPSFTVQKNDTGQSMGFCFTCGVKGSLYTIAKEYEEEYGVMGVVEFVMNHEPGFIIRNGGKRTSNALTKTGFRTLSSFKFGKDLPGFKNDDDEEDKDFSEEVKPWIVSIPKYVLYRGITIETAKAWSLGYDKKERRLVIPVIDRKNRIVGYTKRAIHKNVEPKYRHAKGFKRNRFMFGENMINKSISDVVVTEGHIDVIKLWQAGYNALGTMGSFVSNIQVDKIIDAVGIDGKVYVFSDPDEAGTKLKNDLMDRLKRRIKVIDKQGLFFDWANDPENDDGKKWDAGRLSVEQMRFFLDECSYNEEAING